MSYRKAMLACIILGIATPGVKAESLDYPEIYSKDEINVVGQNSVPDSLLWMEKPENKDLLGESLEIQDKFYHGYMSDREDKVAKVKKELEELGISTIESDENPGTYIEYELENKKKVNVYEVKEGWTIDDFRFTESKDYLVVKLVKNGSDWNQLEFVDLRQKGYPVIRTIKRMKFARFALHKNSVYFRYHRPITKGNELTDKVYNEGIYYHELGSQQPDELIFGGLDSQKRISFFKPTRRSKYLLVYPRKNNESKLDTELLALNLEERHNGFRTIIPFRENQDFSIKGIPGSSKILVFTNYKANNGRIITIDLEKSGEETELISESDMVISSYNRYDDKIVVNYVDGLKSYIYVYSKDGQKFLDKIEFYKPGRVTLGSYANGKFSYSFRSPNSPNRTYTYNLNPKKEEKRIEFVKKSTTKNIFAWNYETKVVEYENQGKKLKMLLAYRKDIDTSKPHPVYMSVYGGFGKITALGYNTYRTYMMDKGIILAYPIVNGSVDEGQQLHDDGRGINKITTINNIISASEYLIDSGITEPKKIALVGTSNGGMVVASCGVLRPDLYAVINSYVPVTDLISFGKFTVGWTWFTEYGNPKDPDIFRANLKFSPYHNVEKDKNYPAFLIWTADYDDRVPPFHALKLATKLQQSGTSNPVVLNVIKESGHYREKTTRKDVHESLVFILENLGID